MTNKKKKKKEIRDKPKEDLDMEVLPEIIQ